MDYPPERVQNVRGKRPWRINENPVHADYAAIDCRLFARGLGTASGERRRADGDERQRTERTGTRRHPDGQDAGDEEKQRVSEVEPVAKTHSIQLLTQQRQHLRRGKAEAVRPLDRVAEHGHGRKDAEALHEQDQPGREKQRTGRS